MSNVSLVLALCVAMAAAAPAQAPVELKVGDKAPDFTLPVNAQIQQLNSGTCTANCGPGPRLAAKLAELNVKKK